MQRRGTAVATAAVFLTVLAAASSASTPGSIVDQSNSYRAPGCSVGSWIPVDPKAWMAQTFIAGVSGALTDAVLRLQGTAQTVNVALTPVDSFGRPAAASPLATASVTGALQPSPAVDVAVAFPVPAKVERGQTYALVVNAPDEDGPNGVHVGWAADLGYFFTDDQGTHCTNGAYAWGRAWANGNDLLGADADFFFRTYVLPARSPSVPAAKRFGLSVRKVGKGVVVSRPAGISCGTKCRGVFSGSVTLSARAATGYAFSRWLGACRGTNLRCRLTLSRATSVTALFRAKTG
jgi:hypothetical protein